ILRRKLKAQEIPCRLERKRLTPWLKQAIPDGSFRGACRLCDRHVGSSFSLGNDQAHLPRPRQVSSNPASCSSYRYDLISHRRFVRRGRVLSILLNDGQLEAAACPETHDPLDSPLPTLLALDC